MQWGEPSDPDDAKPTCNGKLAMSLRRIHQ